MKYTTKKGMMKGVKPDKKYGLYKSKITGMSKVKVFKKY
jgi:hypothetical protein